ncbi:MAG: trigger factor family protein [Bacteroidota bacterium]
MQTAHKQVDGRMLLTIQLDSTDYLRSFLNGVKTYAQQVNAKGFREGSQGHLALVTKRYGEVILTDIVSNKIKEAVDNFLTKEKLLLVGNYALKEEFRHINIAQSSVYTFEVEFIAVPDFELPSFKEIEVKYYEITSATAEDIDDYIKMVQILYSEETFQKPTVSIYDHVTGYFTEEKSTPFTFFVNKGIEQHTAIVGKEKGNIVNFSKEAREMLPLDIIHQVYKSYDVLTKDEDHHFVITDIVAKKPCALDQAFFDKCSGTGRIKGLTSFRKMMQEKLLQNTQRSANLLLEANIIKAYQKKLKLKIPHYTGNQALMEIKSFIIDKILKTKSFEVYPIDMVTKLMELSTLAHVNPVLPCNNKETQKVIIDDVEASLSRPESESYKQAYAAVLMDKSMAFIKANITLNEEKISVKSFRNVLYYKP